MPTVDRDVFARIWEAWRDGYTDAIAEYTRFTKDEVLEYWADMIECIRNPLGYAVWQVPVLFNGQAVAAVKRAVRDTRPQRHADAMPPSAHIAAV